MEVQDQRKLCNQLMVFLTIVGAVPSFIKMGTAFVGCDVRGKLRSPCRTYPDTPINYSL